MPARCLEPVSTSASSLLADHVIPALELQCGTVLHDVRLRYALHGQLNERRDNAILFPTWFAGRHDANNWLIGPGRALDTDHYAIIVVNALGNGESSSPSNHAAMAQGNEPLDISLLDNVRAQEALLQALGVERMHAIVGRSMGAQQALQWACLSPGRAGRIFALCGLPRTTPHNGLMLQAMVDVLKQGLRHGRGAEAVAQAAGIYAAWTLSHEFFNKSLWRGGAVSEADWVAHNVQRNFARFDACDLLCLARTWQSADISRNAVFGGRMARALRAIRVPVFLMPISHDLIFPPQDFHEVLRFIPHATCQTLQSEWGHRAGAPGGAAEDIRVLEHALTWFLTPPRTANDCYAALSHLIRPA